MSTFYSSQIFKVVYSLWLYHLSKKSLLPPPGGREKPVGFEDRPTLKNWLKAFFLVFKYLPDVEWILKRWYLEKLFSLLIYTVFIFTVVNQPLLRTVKEYFPSNLKLFCSMSCFKTMLTVLFMQTMNPTIGFE